MSETTEQAASAYRVSPEEATARRQSFLDAWFNSKEGVASAILAGFETPDELITYAGNIDPYDESDHALVICTAAALLWIEIEMENEIADEIEVEMRREIGITDITS